MSARIKDERRHRTGMGGKKIELQLYPGSAPLSRQRYTTPSLPPVAIQSRLGPIANCTVSANDLAILSAEGALVVVVSALQRHVAPPLGYHPPWVKQKLPQPPTED